MKILPVNYTVLNKNQKIEKKHSLKLPNYANNTNNAYNSNIFSNSFYAFAFMGQRVDKNVLPFIERNANTVPVSVLKYVKKYSPAELEYMSPLQVQKEAYADLELCESVDDVKELFPDEPLFSELKSVNETKATHGILYDISVMNDVLDECHENAIASGEDLTVYLLKKLFMEAKTIEETNNDLHEDINPILQKEDKNYISSSTLKALGVKLPPVSYLNSLKYTRDGYSDTMGKMISDRWKNYSDEEKINRIAALLNGNKNLSPEKREQLRKMHSRLMKNRWENMSSAEKVAYIQKMQSGSEDNRVIMTNAWNKAKTLRQELSKYFVANNFYNPHSIIYRDDSFTNSMGVLMTDFWKNNPKLASEFGEILSQSHVDFQKAKDEDRLKEFIEKTFEERDVIKKEIKQFAAELRNAPKAEYSFEHNFKNTFSYLPEDLSDFMIENISEFPKSHQQIYLNACKGIKVNPKDAQIIDAIDRKLGNSDFSRYAAFLYSSEKMFYEITRPYNGLKSPFLLNEDYLSYSSILSLMSKFKKDGYENVSISQNLLENSVYEKLLKRASLFDLVCNGTVVGTRTVKLSKTVLEKYKYTFHSKPDYESLRANYNRYISEISDVEAQEMSEYIFNALSGMYDLSAVSSVSNKFFEMGSACKIILDNKPLGMQYWIDTLSMIKNETKSVREQNVCNQIINDLKGKHLPVLLSQEYN